MKSSLVFIGSGNVAWHLSARCKKAGFEDIEVCSRNLKSDKLYFERLGIHQYSTSLKTIKTDADIYILCVNDARIVEVADEMALKYNKNQVLLHTSGALESTILKGFAPNFGCCWPIQSLTRGIESKVETFPLCLSANNDYTSSVLQTFANHISKNIFFVDDHHKSKLHLGAVLVNNFTNHLLTLVKNYCSENQLPFHLLYPIMEETVHKVMLSDDVVSLQTGPAIRRDEVAINKHLELLSGEKKLQDLYLWFTKSIQTYNP